MTFLLVFSCPSFGFPAQALQLHNFLLADWPRCRAGRAAWPSDLRMEAAARRQSVPIISVFYGALDQIRHVVAGWSADRWRATALSSGTPRRKFIRR